MNPLLKTFLIAMVPVIELRGAIPIALGVIIAGVLVSLASLDILHTLAGG